MKKIAVLIAALGLAACSGNVEPTAKQIDELYARMTPGERLAQLRATYLNEFFDESGNLDTAKCRAVIPDGIGHFSQYASQMSESPEFIRDRVAVMQDWLINNTPNGIPALFHEEALTGVCVRGATVYPQQIGLACSFDPELAELKTRQTGATLRKIGGRLALSPMVDVVRTPSFNRLEESYGEDAYLSAVMGTAFVKGLQNGDLRKGIGACSKHFLGYGGGGDAPERELMEEILLPHETMIRLGGSKVLMTGYHSFHGKDCVANPELISDILRGYVGFDGMTVSDYGSINRIADPGTDIERAAAAINAGNDVDFPGGSCYRHLPEAIEKGLVSEETFEKAVKRVLAFKARVGLLDTEPNLYDKGEIVFDTPEERETSYKLATESIVLLKNDGTLPLRQGGNIFLTGPNANTMWAMLGDYTFQSMRYFWQWQEEDALHPLIVTLKEGMENRLPDGFTFSYNRGCDWTQGGETIIEAGGDARAEEIRILQERVVWHPEPSYADEALSMASESDVIIAAMGENVLLCGENRNRSNTCLPGKQEEYVESLIATGKPVVLVVFGGRAQVISRIAERCAAVIQAWYPGEEGGNAVADILYGNVSPSAKLSVSYPSVLLDSPICYNYPDFDRSLVSWPFGYGLSYSSFEYTDLSIKGDSATDGKGITVSFRIRNTGDMTADEIAQIYISPDGESDMRPISLQGFGRVSLAPGEEKTLRFRLFPDQFGHYNGEGWTIDPGRFIVKIGASSEDIRLQSPVELRGTSITKRLRDNYFAETL